MAYMQGTIYIVMRSMQWVRFTHAVGAVNSMIVFYTRVLVIKIYSSTVQQPSNVNIMKERHMALWRFTR
jgi:hypothetical protein